MKELYDEFCVYLETKKKSSVNTLNSYKRDIRGFIDFLHIQKIKNFQVVSSDTIDKYVAYLKRNNKSTSTVSRSLSSLRCFFKFLVHSKAVTFDPMYGVKNEKKNEAALPEIMTLEDVNILLSGPDCSTGKGKRDKAMLEVMYATGIRVSELLALKVSDVNAEIGYIIIGKGTAKERVIPIYHIAVNALREYISTERARLLRGKPACNILFLNSTGSEMTRQGFWKIVKHYAENTNIKGDITPKILRHSFATHLLENGADITVIKDMLGHSAISSTKVYAKVLKSKYLSIYESCHPRAKEI